MKKLFKNTLTIIFFIYAISWLHNRGYEANRSTYLYQVKQAFNGVIIGKHHYRGNYIEIISKDEKQEIYGIDSDLYNYCQEGDIIIKYKDVNKCMVTRGKSKSVFKCFYNNESPNY